MEKALLNRTFYVKVLVSLFISDENCEGNTVKYNWIFLIKKISFSQLRKWIHLLILNYLCYLKGNKKKNQIA